jgi:phosphoribosylamine--glycine ligase
VLAARGYPARPARHTPIRSLGPATPGVQVFHAGTELLDGQLVSSGGRVLTVCATAPTLAQARTAAYMAVDAIDWPEGFCRRDIGWRGLAAKA